MVTRGLGGAVALSATLALSVVEALGQAGTPTAEKEYTLSILPKVPRGSRSQIQWPCSRNIFLSATEMAMHRRARMGRATIYMSTTSAGTLCTPLR